MLLFIPKKIEYNVYSILLIRFKKSLKKRGLMAASSRNFLTKSAFSYKKAGSIKAEDYKILYGEEKLVPFYPTKKDTAKVIPGIDTKKSEDKKDAAGKEDKKHVETLSEQYEQQRLQFQKQTFLLIDKLNEIGKGTYLNHFNRFKTNLFEASFSGHQASAYFETIKLRLEQIYFLLQQEKIPAEIRQKEYANLCENLLVCGPGLHTHIETCFNQLNFHIEINLSRWLAQFRTNLISEPAIKLHNKKFKEDKSGIQAGNQVHTVNAFLLYAEKNGWDSIYDIQSNPDNFIVASNISAEEYKEAFEKIKSGYTISSISDYIIETLQTNLELQSATEELKNEKDNWVEYNTKVINNLTNILERLFGTKEIYPFIQLEDAKGDPPKAFLRLNKDKIHQTVIKRGCEEKLFDQKEISLQSKKRGEREFFIPYFLPLSFKLKEDKLYLDHWFALSDEDFLNLLKDNKDAFLKHPYKDFGEFYITILNHLVKSRKSRSLEYFFNEFFDKEFKDNYDIVKHDQELFLIGDAYYFPKPQGVWEYWSSLDDDESLFMLNHLITKNRFKIDKDQKDSKESAHDKFIMELAGHCAQHNKVKTLKLMNEKFKIDLNQDYPFYNFKNEYKKNKLAFIAAINPSKDVIEFLLENKLDLKSIYDGQTLLDLASINNHPKTLKFLIQSNAYNKDNIGHGLYLAIEHQSKDAIDVFMAYIDSSSEKELLLNQFHHKMTYISMAAKKNDINTIRKLVSRGADIDLLHPVAEVIKKNNLEMLRIFYNEFKSDLNFKVDGKSVFHLAIENDNETMLATLINLLPGEDLSKLLTFALDKGKLFCAFFLLNSEVIKLEDVHKVKYKLFQVVDLPKDNFLKFLNYESNKAYFKSVINSWPQVLLFLKVLPFHSDTRFLVYLKDNNILASLPKNGFLDFLKDIDSHNGMFKNRIKEIKDFFWFLNVFSDNNFGEIFSTYIKEINILSNLKQYPYTKHSNMKDLKNILLKSFTYLGIDVLSKVFTNDLDFSDFVSDSKGKEIECVSKLPNDLFVRLFKGINFKCFWPIIKRVRDKKKEFIDTIFKKDLKLIFENGFEIVDSYFYFKSSLSEYNFSHFFDSMDDNFLISKFSDANEFILCLSKNPRYVYQFPIDFGINRLNKIIKTDMLILDNSKSNIDITKKLILFYQMMNVSYMNEIRNILISYRKNPISPPPRHVKSVEAFLNNLHSICAPKDSIDECIYSFISNLKGHIAALSDDKSDDVVRLIGRYNQVLSMFPKNIIEEIPIEEVIIGETHANLRFLEAAKSGDFEKLKQLLAENVNINYQNKSRETAIHLAWKGNHEKIFHFLLEQKDINLDIPEYPSKNTLLINAVNKGDIKTINMLMDKKVDINAKNIEGEFCLYLAWKSNNEDIFKCILLYPKVNIDEKYEDKTLLMLAAQRGDLEYIKALLEKNSDTSILSSDGKSALKFALENNHYQIANAILETHIKKFGVKDISILSAVQCQASHAVHELLEVKADPNSTDSDGRSLLVIAAQEGYTDIARDLLQHGADANKSCEPYSTALYQAIKYGHMEIINLLVKHGVSINTIIGDKPPLYHATSSKNAISAVTTLLARGASVDAIEQSGDAWTSLHKSVYDNNRALINLLLDAKADINKLDSKGRSPVMIALHYNKPVALTALLNRNARIDESIINFAKSKNNEASRKLLEFAENLKPTIRIGLFEQSAQIQPANQSQTAQTASQDPPKPDQKG